MFRNGKWEEDAVHNFFGLTYAAYQVLPRSIMQSMPEKWQQEFVKLMNELDAKCAEHGIEAGKYAVYIRDEKGRLRIDPFCDYERGRRNVFAEFPKKSATKETRP